MADTKTYEIPGVHCGHCEAALTSGLSTVQGVKKVTVDLETKLVSVTGLNLDDAVLRAAIDEAGYKVASH